MLVSHGEDGLRWSSPATVACIIAVDAFDQSDKPKFLAVGQEASDWLNEIFGLDTVQDAQELECTVAMCRILDEDWARRPGKSGRSPTSRNLSNARSLVEFGVFFGKGLRTLDAHCLGLRAVSALSESGLPPMVVESFLRRFCGPLGVVPEY
jgi:hypothetical protein